MSQPFTPVHIELSCQQCGASISATGARPVLEWTISAWVTRHDDRCTEATK